MVVARVLLVTINNNLYTINIKIILDNQKLNESINYLLNKEFVNKFMKAFKEIGCTIVDEKPQAPIVGLNSRDIRQMVAESVMKILKKKL